MKRIAYPKASVTYLLRITWQDDKGLTFDSPLYVGNDDTLSLDQLEQTTRLWLRNAIEPRARCVLAFTVLQTFKP